MNVNRVFVEKRIGYDIEGQHLFADLKESLEIENLEGVRIINRYDVEDLEQSIYEKAKNTIFSEPNVDTIYDETVEFGSDERVFAVEYLPGQYDQRADSAAQCIQILSQGEKPIVKFAKYMVLKGQLSDIEFEKIKSYCINPVDSREAEFNKLESLKMEEIVPGDVLQAEGFNDKSDEELKGYITMMGFAMSFEDLKLVQNHFKNDAKRNPTITELKVIDTYWSDHCRHTTFATRIEEISFEEGQYKELFEKAYARYKESRDYVYGETDRDICLMDIAIIAVKELRKKGKLENLDVSEEINACSIVVNVDVDGKDEEWLIMFKNETHNHPTEIEPFGGAATCLGGAIRDPLSGRSYVYQAMRVTGSADPRTKIEDTLPGKLPQKKITTGAAQGYSSYGNQIGLATGQVSEVYDEDFVAKRMEVGAVIAAAPKKNVIREIPAPGDVIILLGGRTGRDGCGGATGSSKEHDEESIINCGAEVQKGNPPTERNIQRLFRRAEAAQKIKRCNDFGAGGVSVAIGELADSIEVNLDLVPKKYEGLDGTELAISESQERMAVVVEAKDVEVFINYAEQENLVAVAVAKVTDDGMFRMKWRNKTILELSRAFLNTNGAIQKTDVKVDAPQTQENYFKKASNPDGNVKAAWIENLKDLNVASQKGLVERFDSTIGANTVLMPLGGKHQLTPEEGMAGKIPLLKGETSTGTLMSYGYNPKIGKWSPFHGAMYAVIESVTKIVAMGGAYEDIRLSFQEYFEKLGEDPSKWGKPFSALLGALMVQKELEIGAIGGKDSMSGTFKEINVPPTLISFAVAPVDVNHVMSSALKKADSTLVLISTQRDENDVVNFEDYRDNMTEITNLIKQNRILSAKSIVNGGIAAAITKMAFGNRIGVLLDGLFKQELFEPSYGSMIVEVESGENIFELFKNVNYRVIGKTIEAEEIQVSHETLPLEELQKIWEAPLETIFPTKESLKGDIETISYKGASKKYTGSLIAKPRVFVPVFPGTNCEYDTKRAFEKAGAEVNLQIFRNLTPLAIEESLKQMEENIKSSQIIMIPGGFSGGDEPEGSGKFIAAAFRNPRIKEAVMSLIQDRDGLMLGICNGFQALIKLGLVPYGEIRDIDVQAPTLTFNRIGRHASCLVKTRIASNQSPWLQNVEVGDQHHIAISHGEGRFVADKKMMDNLIENGQIATQYVDFDGKPSYDIKYNPNGSMNAVEGITSLDGRIFGKMGHSERIGANLYKNVLGEKDQKIFESGVNYFK